MFERYGWVDYLLLIVLIASLFNIISILNTTNITEKEKYEIWSADAPYGRYWTDINGRFYFYGGYIDSAYVESYTIKYLDNDELKTVIVSSTDDNTHLYFTTNSTHYMIIETYKGIIYHEPIYYIYLPEPEEIND